MNNGFYRIITLLRCCIYPTTFLFTPIIHFLFFISQPFIA